MKKVSREAQKALRIFDKIHRGEPLTEKERKGKISPEVWREIKSLIDQNPIAKAEAAKLKAETDLLFLKVGTKIHNAFKDLYIEQLQRSYEPIKSGLKEGQNKLQRRNTEREASRDARREVIRNFLASRQELLSDTFLLFHLDGELVSQNINPVTFKVLRSDLRAIGIEPKVKLTEVR